MKFEIGDYIRGKDGVVLGVVIREHGFNILVARPPFYVVDKSKVVDYLSAIGTAKKRKTRKRTKKK